MNKKLRFLSAAVIATLGMTVATTASANVCSSVSYAEFTAAVDTAYGETNQFGFGLPMWATLMNTGGKVCYIYSVKGMGQDGGGGVTGSPVANGGHTSGNNAWLGSRVISAQKANSANGFSIDGLAISTGAVTALTYEGGSLFGLQASNPVDATVAYAGSFGAYGTETDPLGGLRIGGLNYFGGGVAVYGAGGSKVGAVGVSGDTSCRDHTMAYRLRIALGFNNQPNDDGLVLIDPPTGLFQQPTCGVNDPDANVSNTNDHAADDFGIRDIVL